jgi:hypothetical protein
MIKMPAGALAGACLLSLALLSACENNPIAVNPYGAQDNSSIGWKRPDGGVATDAEYVKARSACTDEIKAGSTDQIQSVPGQQIMDCLHSKGWKSFQKK